MAVEFEFLDQDFLRAMNDIGRLGFEKYGPDSFHAKHQRNEGRGDNPRNQPSKIAEHAYEHFREYLAGVRHDKFQTYEHQLAASAFNAMMEAFFYKSGRATLNTD